MMEIGIGNVYPIKLRENQSPQRRLGPSLKNGETEHINPHIIAQKAAGVQKAERNMQDRKTMVVMDDVKFVVGVIHHSMMEMSVVVTADNVTIGCL